MRKWLLILAWLGCTFLLLISLNFFSPQQLDNKYFRIHRGESAYRISQRLAAADIIRSRSVFYWLTRLSGKAKYLSYGLYHFDGELNSFSILKKIEQGRVQLRRITIPEGLPLQKTFALLSEENFGDYARFDSLSHDPALIKELTGFELNSLEGFIYPETYFFPEEAAERYILETMVNQYFAQTENLDFSGTNKLDYYQTLILASIVEREAKVSDEKSLIASVYLNRLEIDMKLQADPTVAYCLEKIGKKRKKIYYKDLKIDSPYNTYLYKGLPPTPICSPSQSAIVAVLNPDETDYLYFFASGGGKHTFSQTYSQHLSRQRK